MKRIVLWAALTTLLGVSVSAQKVPLYVKAVITSQIMRGRYGNADEIARTIPPKLIELLRQDMPDPLAHWTLTSWAKTKNGVDRLPQITFEFADVGDDVVIRALVQAEREITDLDKGKRRTVRDERTWKSKSVRWRKDGESAATIPVDKNAPGALAQVLLGRFIQPQIEDLAIKGLTLVPLTERLPDWPDRNDAKFVLPLPKVDFASLAQARFRLECAWAKKRDARPEPVAVIAVGNDSNAPYKSSPGTTFPAITAIGKTVRYLNDEFELSKWRHERPGELILHYVFLEF